MKTACMQTLRHKCIRLIKRDPRDRLSSGSQASLDDSIAYEKDNRLAHCAHRGRRWRDSKHGATAYLLGLACSLSDPGLGFIPGLVKAKEAGLTATLNELVGLRNELSGEDPAWELCIGGDGVGSGIPGDLGDLGGGEGKGSREGCGRIDGGCPLKPVGQKQLGIVLANSCFGK